MVSGGGRNRARWSLANRTTRWGDIAPRRHAETLFDRWSCRTPPTYDTYPRRLLLGSWQVNELLAEADEAELTIALMHHPWAFYPDWDSSICQAEINRACDLVLRGHLHSSKVEERASAHSSILEGAAGACYETSEWPNSYQLLEIDPSARKVRVHLRLWDRGGRREWIPDRNAFEPDGTHVFEL